MKGFKVCAPVLKKYCDSITNFEICFEEDVSLLGFFQGQKVNCHTYAKRTPISELPDDEQEVEKYLYKLYQEKDEWQKSFQKHKNLNQVAHVAKINFGNNWKVLVNQIFWTIVVTVPLFFHFVSLLFSGFYTVFLIEMGVVAVISKYFAIDF